MTKLENVKNGQIHKNYENLKPSCIKASSHNLRCKTAINIEFDYNRQKKHSFIADNKLKVDQRKRKLEANFSKSLFIWKSNTFKSQNDHRLSSNQQDTKEWSKSGTQLEISLVSFFWNVMLFNYFRRDRFFFL